MERTRNISKHFTSTSLTNKRCFILGGGPSLRGFNYQVLKDEFTIGINKTFTTFHSTINYSMDTKFYRYVSAPGTTSLQQNLHNAWKAYDGYRVFLDLGSIKKIIFNEKDLAVTRIRNKCLSLDIGQGIFSGNNSGFGALMMAIAMGCKEIFLLGYDMGIISEKITHWHEGYPNWIQDDETRKYAKFIKLFEEFAPTISEQGIKVYNLNPASALNCFEKTTIAQVLQDKISIGDKGT